MKCSVRLLAFTLAAALLALGSAGCTPVQKGFQDGVSDALAAAVAALIEVPINFMLDQALDAGE